MVVHLLQCHCVVPGSEATLQSLGLGSHLCFLALDCECTQGSSILTQLCAFIPGSTAGTLEPLLSPCPVWVFISQSVSALGPHCSVLVVPLTAAAAHGVPEPPPAAQWVSIHGLAVPVWASAVWPRNHRGVCTLTTYLCQKLWRRPSPSHLFRLWHGLCTGWMWK